MPLTIDPTKLPPELTAKYSLTNNALRLDKVFNAELDKYKSEPKDEVNTIIGDDKVSTDFLPQIKLCRWTNETNFSLRLVDNEVGLPKVSFDKDHIFWEKGNIKIEYYDYAENSGGYKMVWYLKSKPTTNKVEFTIQSKGLDFFYQPPLTEEFQNGYSERFQKEIVVSETQVKDLDGNVLVGRPENVVGSYAVYHSTKGGMNDIYGKDYKVGKAFHIFRPRIIDAEGKEIWGILKIENGIYSVEIPREFLDTVVYPIRSNDEIGYHPTSGGTAIGPLDSTQAKIAGMHGQVTATTGDTLTSYSVYATTNRDPSDTALMTLYSVVSGNPTSPIAVGTTVTVLSNGSTFSWNNSATISQAMANGTTYCVVVGFGSVVTNLFVFYDAGTAPGRFNSSSVAFTDPFAVSGTDSGRHYWWYATYTPSGGGATGTETGRKLNMAIHFNNPAIA